MIAPNRLLPSSSSNRLQRIEKYLDSGELAETDGYQARRVARELLAAAANLLAREHPARAARIFPRSHDRRSYEPAYVDRSLLAKATAIKEFTDESELDHTDAEMLYEHLLSWLRELAARGGCSRKLLARVPARLPSSK